MNLRTTLNRFTVETGEDHRAGSMIMRKEPYGPETYVFKFMTLEELHELRFLLDRMITNLERKP
jgi:hypothetical protein